MIKKLLILFLPCFLFADLDERVRKLEEQMKQVSTTTSNKTFGASFSPDNFGKEWLGLSITGDALYWHTKIGGTEYAYNILSDAIGFKGPESGSTDDQEFSWDWGARAGLGLVFPGIGWEIGLTGTWYKTHQTENRSKDLPSILINLKGVSLDPSHHVKSTDEISYRDALFELKKYYFLSRLLSTNTTIGVRRSWIDQEQKVLYDQLQVKDLSNFNGIGPRMGFGTKWHLFLGLSLIGDFAGSLLYGEFKVSHKENEVDLSANTHLFSPSVELLTGLAWDIYKRSCHFGILFAYEAFYIWRQNEALYMEDQVQTRFQLVRYAEDLTFYGLTIRMKLEF